MAKALAALLAPLSAWSSLVNLTVPEPYLDEVFHVRQAQSYCNGRFDIWDPKITTPPGLYYLSYGFSKTAAFFQTSLGLGDGLSALNCSLGTLRAGNVLGLILLVLVIRAAYTLRTRDDVASRSFVFDHAALNIALFSPLFFFSALYYTDIWSAAFVLVSYLFLPGLHHTDSSAWARSLALFMVGLASLLFRQTNIFWVAVFPAGLTLVQQLDRGHQAVKDSMYCRTEGFGDNIYSIAKTSWKLEVVYDPPMKDAEMDDFVKTLVSITACTAKLVTHPKRLIRVVVKLAPFLALLIVFAAFVSINGGVVLGDKSNHVAALHLPQMLYIWPFIVFFSWPLLYPYLLLMPVSFLAWLPAFTSLESTQTFKRRRLLPRLWLVGLGLGVACLTVYGNTVVHPFTRADNRHYIFYVFRYLLDPWWIRYAVTPVYIICAWACLQTLGGGPPADYPFQRSDSREGRPLPLPDGQHSATTSFALVWLMTTALQLITAPLVEPRYFILPWIFWRMHVPLRSPPKGSKAKEGTQAQLTFSSLWEEYDHRLWLETVWLLFINAVTGYMFLYRGFTWLQEPGKVQRFMW
ncbi:glycosyltransferase family 59 protein [Baudoinia panamericana UAMH 10762]|uniref:Dol-P-Glc:Glc(2)Man(9)GlcNAc(2)-PP-Dol alpha-1,2-glucosyltransferase n=1 Tax=Baudoinia panamericana (strain UAMH 10762) TaxID=717646 RepID=M2MM25_BAUPA|nr:glycosyltransferase family 59 protein [Baudoinia panamericana UAMH 10762]EMC97731.1 glycosyltransferase family 59 protein [Baudoinia panamericana UAMH 10762]